eukprot:XP_011660789.1 PREDICTED: uncharacterized protein LOC105436675 [Strongylocentrotus purpuratus]
MAIFKQKKFFGFLFIILVVGSNCSGKVVNTPDTESLPTTRIPDENDDASAVQEMVVEMQDLGTHSSLQPPITNTGEDLVSGEVATQPKDPGHGSKRHQCGFIDSCVGRCGSGPSDRDSIYTYIVSTEKRTPIRTGYLCFCDSRCSLYGDCCSDYDVQCQCNGNELNGKTDLTQETDVLVEHEGILVVSPTISIDASSTGPQEQSGELLDDPSIRRDMLECKHLDEVEFGSLLVEMKCHPDWKNKNIETLCTNIDYRDDIAKLFVQGGDHITYRNIFCAECNFVKVFHFWIQDAYCYGELPTSVYEQPERLSNYLRKNCMTKFRVPFGYVFRPCLKMVDSCPKGISQESEWVEQNCVSGHLSVVTAENTSPKLWGSTLYRNSLCAECNGVDESLIRCPTKDMLKKHFLRNSTHRNDSKPSNGDGKITNRIVTNYNMAAKDQSSTVVYRGNGLVVPIVDTCEDGQVFDPYLGNCRQLYCSDGYVLVKQNCVPAKATDELDDDDIITMVEAITAVINETVGLEDELVITVKICMERDYSEHDVKAPAPGKGKLPPDHLVFNSSVWDIYVSPIHPNDSFTDHELTDFALLLLDTSVLDQFHRRSCLPDIWTKTAGGDPDQSPISIKGSNNFTGESINAIREGQSLQLVCVVRNTSLGDISWLRDSTQVTYNGTVISQDRRYGIQFDASEKGRRFFRLSIRNISRNDSGNFTCSSLVQGIGSSVDIHVRFAPSSEYPTCSREVSSANTTSVGYSCSTERGVPPYTTRWFRNGLLQNASHGVSTENENGVFTSIIRTASNESIDPFLECRLYLRSRKTGRRCCIGGGGVCNSPTGHTSQATTNINQDASMVTEAVEYYSESTTDTTNATSTTGVPPNSLSYASPRQTEELAITTTLTSQTTSNQNTLVTTDESFDVTTHNVQSSTMLSTGAGQINEPTTSLLKNNESLENVSNGTTDSPGIKSTTDSIDVTEINNLTITDLGFSDEGTDINIDQDGGISRPVTDAFHDKTSGVTPSDATTFETPTSSLVPTTSARKNNEMTSPVVITTSDIGLHEIDGITETPLTSLIPISTAPADAEGTERGNRGRISSTFDPSDATRSLHDIRNSSKSDDLTTNVLGFDDVSTQYVTTIQTIRSTGNLSNKSELNDTWGTNPIYCKLS